MINLKQSRKLIDNIDWKFWDPKKIPSQEDQMNIHHLLFDLKPTTQAVILNLINSKEEFITFEINKVAKEIQVTADILRKNFKEMYSRGFLIRRDQPNKQIETFKISPLLKGIHQTIKNNRMLSPSKRLSEEEKQNIKNIVKGL